MKEILQKYLTVLRKDRSRQMKLMGILTVLSVMVIAAVAWQLRFVGIAKADKPTCGMEEHVHTEACIRKELVCTLKEGEPEPTTEPTEVVHHHGPECYEEVRTLHCTEKEHTHSDKCYEIKKILDCSKEEHVHTATCYAKRNVLVCNEDHEHTDDCYEQREVPVCGKEEHTHNDDCYRVELNLICGEKEHAHGDSCYTVEQKLICGMEEGQVLETAPVPDTEPKLHVHTDACYKDVYICGKEEHNHTLECYANPEMDLETYQDWEKTFPKEWGKTWNENVLLMAQSQMGYKESETNFQIGEDGETKKGYTRYGAWYGNPYGDWNTMFVSFCINNADIPAEAVPKAAGAYAFSTDLKEMELYENSTYTPKPGDIVFLQDPESKKPTRTAVVASLGDMIMDDQKLPCITVIEGDLKNAVGPYKYPIEDSMIVGYLSMSAAYDRAVSMGLFLEDEMEVTPETAETTEPSKETEGRELTDDELDAKLAVVLDTFDKKAELFSKYDRRGSEKSARAVRLEMDKLFLEIQKYHSLRYPNAGEADFVKYMKQKVEKAYKAYTLACQKYPAKEQQKPIERPEKLNTETVKLLKTMTDKAVAFENAIVKENAAEIRSLADEMNLLYDKAMNLYLEQYTEKTEEDFSWYVEKNYPKADAMLKEAENRLHIRALNDMLQGKLSVFSDKAMKCAQAMNIGDKSAESLKLELDQLYDEMKNLHAKRYPDADEGDFVQYLKNKDISAVERYESALKAFPNVNNNSTITLSEPEEGNVERNFLLEDGMQVDVSIVGTICFPMTGNAAQIDNENQKQNSKWKDIQLELTPVSEDDELAFADFIVQNYPDALGMTMMGIKYQYNGLNLNVDGAKIDMTVLPSAESLNAKPQIPAMMLGNAEQSTAPVIQNISETKSLPANDKALENQKSSKFSVQQPLDFIVLKKDAKGNVSAVNTTALDENTKERPSIRFVGEPAAAYARVLVPRAKDEAAMTPDKKPLDPPPAAYTDGATYANAKAYPDYWGQHVKHIDGTDAVTESTKETFEEGKTLILRNDPYFQEAVRRWPSKGGVFGYETPSATLGYVMRNYNVFTFNDAIISHVVGSTAVQGTTWYETWQGGTGAGGTGSNGNEAYVRVPNFAPTYLKGKVKKMAASYNNPLSDTPTLSSESQDIEIMVNTGSVKDPDKGFPTYFGTANTGSVKMCSIFAGKNPGVPLPWYFSDQYMQFNDFRNQTNAVLQNNQIKGIHVLKSNTDARLARDHYQWCKKDNEEFTRLYLRMGHTYNIGDLSSEKFGSQDMTDLQGVQIVLVPPDGYDFGGKTEVHDRSAMLALDKIVTMITCNAGKITLPGIENHAKVPAITYYVSDISKNVPFSEEGQITDVMLAGHIDEKSSNSVVLSFPYATHVEMGKRAGHVLVPNGTLYIPNTGDNYGCNMAFDLKCAGDLHMLPFEGKGDGIDAPIEVELPPISKDVRDGNVIRAANENETFTFRLESDKRIHVKANTQDETVETLPKHHWDTTNVWDGVKHQSPIKFEVLEAILKDPKQFATAFKDAIPEDSGHFEEPVDEDTGTYIFKLYEVPNGSDGDLPLGKEDYLRDKDVYTVEITAIIQYLPDGTLDSDGKPHKKNFLCASDITFKDSAGTEVEHIVFQNRVKKATPQLPNTGGMGVMPFYLAGTISLIGAGAYIIGKKRKVY